MIAKLSIQVTFIIFASCILLTNSAYYSWDTSTQYAKFYNVSGSQAVSDIRVGSIPYLLATKEAVTKEHSKIRFLIKSYGEAGNPLPYSLNVGLITDDNK